MPLKSVGRLVVLNLDGTCGSQAFKSRVASTGGFPLVGGLRGRAKGCAGDLAKLAVLMSSPPVYSDTVQEYSYRFDDWSRV